MSVAEHRLKITTGSAEFPLFNEIREHLKGHYLPCQVKTFTNQNIKVKILESVRGDDVYVVQPCYPDLDHRLVELFITIDALRHASAYRITVVLPYFPYSRSDKKDEARISITARLMCELLKASGVDRVITMQLHSPQVQGFFNYPVDHLLPGKTICRFFRDQVDLKDYVVVAPDSGSAKNAGKYANKLDLPLVVIDKRRVDDSESPRIVGVLGEVKGKNCLLLDDEIATGGSIIRAAEKLLSLGALKVEACATHGVFSGDAIKNLQDSPIEKVYITNTIWDPTYDSFNKLVTISVAEMFARSIICTHQNESMTQVFERY